MNSSQITYTQPSVYAIWPLIGFFLLLILTLIVFLKDKKSSIHHNFSFLNLCAALWNLDVFILFTIHNSQTAFRIDRIFQIPLILIPLSLINFIHIFVEPTKKRKLNLFLISWTFFLIILSQTDLYLQEMKHYFFGYYSKAGPLYFLYVLTFLFSFTYTTALLYKKTKVEKDPISRNQAKYLFTANLMMGILGATNFLPLYELPIYPIGNIAVIFYALTVSIAIIKHKLMDIKIFFQKSIIYTILTAVLTSIYIAIFLTLRELFKKYLVIDSLFISIIAMIFIFFLFQPFKEKIDNKFDQLFFKKPDYPKMLKEFSQNISSVLDVDILFTTITNAIIKIMHIDKGCLFIVNQKSGKLEIKHTVGITKNNLQKANLDSNISYLSFLNQYPSPIEVNYLPKNLRYEPSLLQFQENLSSLGLHLAFPLINEKQTIGLLLLGQKLSDEIYHQKDIEFITAIINQATIAIQRAILHEKIKEEEKLTALGRSSTVVAHEIRNPLNIIKGAVSYLSLKCKDNNQIKEFIKIINEEADRINHFISDLLTTSHPYKPRLQLIDINYEISNFFQSFKQQIENHYTITMLLKKDLPKIYADSQYLRQVFLNLTKNAIEAMSNGGELKIETKLQVKNPDYEKIFKRKKPKFINPNNSNFIEINFKDTGSGIQIDDLKNLFEPFYTTKETGTGLGLFIINSIVEAHNGTIKVENRTNKGAVFKILLPIAR